VQGRRVRPDRIRIDDLKPVRRLPIG
jgi:hypothetical protein